MDIYRRQGKVMFSQVSVHNLPHGYSFTARPCYCAVDTHPTRILSCYRPQRSCGQGNIFTPVCHSFCSQGGLPQCMLGCHQPPPREQTTPPPTGFPPIREFRENFEDFFQSGKSGKKEGFSAKIREKNFKSGNFFSKPFSNLII